MFNIIGVKFRNISKVYYFDPRDLKVRYHDHVIVETARGLEYGTVVMSPTKGHGRQSRASAEGGHPSRDTG